MLLIYRNWIMKKTFLNSKEWKSHSVPTASILQYDSSHKIFLEILKTVYYIVNEQDDETS